MPAPQHRNFDPAENFPSVIMDALQKFLAGGGVFDIRIKPGAANTLQVPAADDNNSVVALPIEGKWRYVTASVEQAGSGGAGLRDVWAVTTANAYAPGTPGEVDTTDYSFQLRVTAVGAPPAGFAHIRKVAQALWSGTIWQDVVPYRNGALVDPEGARPGTIKPWPFSWAPIGWVFCDAAALAAASPSTLRDQLLADASKFGVSGADPRVPDGRGRTFVGEDGTANRLTANDALGQAGGAEKVALSDPTQLPPHTHSDGTLAAASAGSHNHGGAITGDGSHTHGFGGWAVPGGSANDPQPFFKGTQAPGSGQFTLLVAPVVTVTNLGGTDTAGSGHSHGINADGTHGHDVTGATGSTGSAATHDNMQPHLTLNWIIKT